MGKVSGLSIFLRDALLPPVVTSNMIREKIWPSAGMSGFPYLLLVQKLFTVFQKKKKKKKIESI